MLEDGIGEKRERVKKEYVDVDYMFTYVSGEWTEKLVWNFSELPWFYFYRDTISRAILGHLVKCLVT